MRVASTLLTIAAGLLPKGSEAKSERVSVAHPSLELPCNQDTSPCPDGTFVTRDWNNGCQFRKCPASTETCPQDDVKTCPDGTSLSRDPKLGCEFPECELTCCNPLKVLRFPKGAKCCGATGKWVSSSGDGSFECGGVVSRGPDFPAPFGEPCPVNCNSIQRKKLCRVNAEHGCRWLGKKQCMNEKDIPCEKLTKRYFCKGVEKCKWRKGKCGPLCRQPDLSTSSCIGEYQPVTCRNGCVYGNMCNARAAGQNTEKCKRTCQSNGECEEKEVCFKDYKSCTGLNCAGTCVKQTGNTCDGFSGTRCPMGEKCVLTPCPPGVMDSCGGHCVDNGCRNPRKNECGKDFNPVTCGDGCEYKNQCLANHAGYDETQCKGFCPLPDYTVFCPLTFPLYVCGDAACEYSSCHLESTGFSMDQCKPDCKTTPCPEIYCPKPRFVEGECCPTCDETVVKHDCSSVKCATPKCGDGRKPIKMPGDCCPQCEDTKQPDCLNADCAEPICAGGETPVIPEHGCCPQCPTDCSKEFCPVPKCTHGHKLATKQGKCCPGCVPDPCSKPDCSLVFCAELKCGEGEEQFTPDGHCCPTKCVKTPFCRMRCPAIGCGENEELVRQAGHCCPKCKKKCMSK